MKTLLYFMFGLLLTTTVQAKSFNFVFILSDDQSWRGTSIHMDPNEPGSVSDYYQTPNLKKLFESGMRFSRGYAPAPYCCPTRRSLLIGQSPARHLYQKDQEGWTSKFRKQLSIPQLLKRIDPNYQTAHFGKWDHRFDEVTPEAMGYDVSDGATGNGEGGSRDSGGPAAKDDPKLIGHISDRACAFMADCQKQGKPFYVQLSHYAVHLDIYYKQATLDKVQSRPKGKLHDIAAFAAMTEDMDAGVGQVLQEIESLGLTASTFIIFMSDNGGRTGLPGFDSANLNTPLREGKGTMYEGGIRVPFAIAGPGIEAGAVSSVPVSGVDLLPTLADLLGQPLTGQALKQLDGGSLKPVLFEGEKKVARANGYLIFHHAVARKPQTALMEDDFKLVVTWKSALDATEQSKGKLELFNLAKDLSESKDLSAQMPNKAQRLYEQMTNYLTEVGATTIYAGGKKKSKRGKSKKKGKKKK